MHVEPLTKLRLRLGALTELPRRFDGPTKLRPQLQAITHARVQSLGAAVRRGQRAVQRRAADRRPTVDTERVSGAGAGIRERRVAVVAEIARHPEWTSERIYERAIRRGLWENDDDFAAHRDRNRKRVARLRESAAMTAPQATSDAAHRQAA